MRPYLDKILEDQGIEGVIAFLQNVRADGVLLVNRETDALAKLITELQENK